jgi:MerR family transcriptional regulator/heat shock protein HspR
MERRSDDRPRYSISVAAELTGLHPQTLRVYDAKGLVRPRRTPGGTRRYSERDLERLLRISQLTCEAGLNLTGVVQVLELEAQVERLTAQVRSLERQLAEAALRQKQEITSVHKSYRRELVRYETPQHPLRIRRT